MKLAPVARVAALFSVIAAVWTVASTSSQRTLRPIDPEPGAVAAFRAAADDQVSLVTIELKAPKLSEPASVLRSNLEILQAHRQARLDQHAAFIASLPARGVELLPSELDALQPDGVTRRIKHRYTQVLNGFSAYVVNRDLDRLRAQPEVRSVSIDETVRVKLNKGVDYSLGNQFNPMDRRLAVYGATEELTPAGDGGSHPETPFFTTIDGVEGQGIVTVVIDTGVDWKHPMFGGTGQTTPNPQFPPAAPSANDNKKVTYLLNFTAGAPGDDFGHGTFVGTNMAGYRVDGLTPPNPGYGTGPDGTGIGPTPGGVVLHGIAPQATIMAYKTLSAAGAGVNNSTQLALDDSVSPCVTAVDTSGQCVEKPIADVVNLSLGGGGSASSAGTKTANNAALAGAIIVASAGNDGPDPTSVGAPCMGTMVICIGASLDPGSLASGAVLAPGEIPGETQTGPGPSAEFGADSDANASQPGEQQAMRIFVAAGGGPVDGGSVSAHYVYANMADGNPPAEFANRIALVRGTGAFAGIANYAAPLQPVAILIISDVQTATAVTVVGGVPTYTIPVATADYLRGLNGGMAHGDISQFPMRVTESVSIDEFVPAMAGFSSRGPNAVSGSDYRNIKPDVTAPGSGILAGGTPDGNPDGALGMANPNGYLVASGTSFSGPITAGAVTLIRQHVRDNLGFDTTDIDNDPDYRTKRFEAATISRALLQNNATNLRTGRGVPEEHGSDSTTLHDLGSGHIDISAALDAKAVMMAPTKLLGDGTEFDMPALNPPELDAAGNLDVMLPTHAFGQVGLAGSPTTLSKAVTVTIRDVTAGDGAGVYTLAMHDDINMDLPGVSVEFLALDAETLIDSVTVPSGGSAEFFVQVSVDGTQFTAPNTDLAWYVTAEQSGSGRALSMPFYLRATQHVPNLVTVAPDHTAPTNVETPAEPPACGTDTDGAYTLNFSYTPPEGGPSPVNFRIQEGTTSSAIFEDPADEPLTGGANSLWSGSPQWSTSTNPETGNPAYFVPNTLEQNEALTMIDAVTLPSSATLMLDTTRDTETGYDYTYVELLIGEETVVLDESAGGLLFGGYFTGTQTFDLSPWAGQDVRLQLRLTSDANTNGSGWWVENIRIEADDFATIAEVPGDATTLAVDGRTDGTRYYRVAGLFDLDGTQVSGPFSELQCATVELAFDPPIANAGADIEVNEGSAVSLDGTGSTDPEGGALTFSWTQTAGPAVTLTGADTATPSFNAPIVDAYTELAFELEVVSETNLRSTDSVAVAVKDIPAGNLPPIADAGGGSGTTVDEGATVILDGAGSSDPNGDPLTYSWTQMAGPTVSLANADSVAAQFTAPAVNKNQTVSFRLTVSDGIEQSTDDISMVVRNLDAPLGETKILGGAVAAGSLLLLTGFAGLSRRRRT